MFDDNILRFRYLTLFISVPHVYVWYRLYYDVWRILYYVLNNIITNKTEYVNVTEYLLKFNSVALQIKVIITYIPYCKNKKIHILK